MPYSARTTENAAEGVGLDDVGADVEERSVQLLDGVRLRDTEELVAALERGATEVVGVQVLRAGGSSRWPRRR